MIFDGEWRVTKYKITRTVVTYDDNPELYPDSTAEEIVLTAERSERLDEIRYTTMDQADAIAYVMDGIGTPPDNRTNIDKLMDLLPELELYTAIDFVEQWEPDTRYLKNAYIKTGGKLYRVRQTHTSQEHQPPDAEGMLAIYLPYTPPGQITDYDPDRNLAANPYQVGELVRFPYGVYECKRITNYSPQEYAPDWVKRDDLT